MSDIFKLEKIFQIYMRRHLSRQFRFDIAQCRVVLPLDGTIPNVRIVETEDGREFVIRIIERKDHSLAEHIYTVDDLLSKNDVPAPKLLDYHQSEETQNLVFLAEENVKGEAIGGIELTTEKIQSLAQTFSQLHKVRSSEWGPLIKPKGSGYAHDQLRKARNRLQSLRRRSDHYIELAEIKKVGLWLKSWRPLIEGIRVFHLIHNKIGKSSLIYDHQNNSYAFIDLTTLQYGHPDKDLIPLYHNVFKLNANYISIFKETYWKNMTLSERQEAESLEPFFHAYYHLSECATGLRRISKRKSGGYKSDPKQQEKFTHHWEQLLDIIEQD